MKLRGKSGKRRSVIGRQRETGRRWRRILVSRRRTHSEWTGALFPQARDAASGEKRIRLETPKGPSEITSPKFSGGEKPPPLRVPAVRRQTPGKGQRVAKDFARRRATRADGWQRRRPRRIARGSRRSTAAARPWRGRF